MNRYSSLSRCAAKIWALIYSLSLFALVGPCAAQTPAPNASDPVAALKAELEQLKGKLPDQSHVMKDVGYHFSNLWFAGEKRNWPLAKFYLDETRSHLKWAVRVIPVRKIKGGELDLRAMLESLDGPFFGEIQKAIAAQDEAKFVESYKHGLEACYTCHKAAEKAFLRPQVPTQPEAPIINFDPAAKWPE
jgi:hypothetical protein